MPLSLVKAWTSAQKRLKEAHIESPVIDARLLLEAATGATRSDIVTDPHRELSPEQETVLDDYIEQRCQRKPVARILGRKGFWKLLLNLNEHVLIPRPETECIVDMILKATRPDQDFHMADLGVGSGAIILSVLAERPAAKGMATDISSEAIAVARDNAAHLGLTSRVAFMRTSWGSGLDDGQFDFIASNPPYIRSDIIESLEPEVKHHDPILALDGGPSGLEAYKALVPDVFRLLKPMGIAYLEIGYDQSQEVESLMKSAGFSDVVTYLDLSNQPRVVLGQKKALGN